MTQLSFWAGEGAENEFKVLWKHMKYRFHDLTQTTFCAGKEAENEFT